MKKFLVALFAVIAFAVPTVVLADCAADCADQLNRCLDGASTIYNGPSQTTQLQQAQGICSSTFTSCNAACSASSQPSNLPSGSSTQTNTGGSSVALINPLGTTDPRVIIGNLIHAILSIIGSVTLLMFVYGGVIWITSMGDDKKVLKGKQILVWCVIGLAIIAGAYALTNAAILGLTTGSVTGAVSGQ